MNYKKVIVGMTKMRIGNLVLLLIFCFGLTGTVMASQDPYEEPDGSFKLDIGGEVEVELVFTRGAFRNLPIIMDAVLPNGDVQTTFSPPIPSCTLGSLTEPNCFFNTDQCITGFPAEPSANITEADSCHPPGVPPGTNEEIDCGCRLNFRRTLGTFPAGTKFRTKLISQDRNPPNATFQWSHDKNQNIPADGFDHLRTTKIGPGLWRLEWEDAQGGFDADFNDAVIMFKVASTAAPEGSLLFTSAEKRCIGTLPPEAPPPELAYYTNITVDPLTGDSQLNKQRRMTLTAVLFNLASTDRPYALCPMANFDQKGPEVDDIRDFVGSLGYTHLSGNGIPDCNEPIVVKHRAPHVRFSLEGVREVLPFTTACVSDAFPTKPGPRDIVQVPGNGTTTLLYEVTLGELDEGITNVDDKFSDRDADRIKADMLVMNDRCNNTSAENRDHFDCVLYTDLMYNFGPDVQSFLCPHGVNTFYDARPSCSVAQVALAWNPVSTVSVASSVSVPIALHSIIGHDFTENEEVILDVLWADNLATPLTGHLTTQPPARVPFIMTPQDGRDQTGQLDLTVPDDLPEGFFGTAMVILNFAGNGPFAGTPIVSTNVNFAKDTTPPTILGASTERSATHEVSVTVRAEDAAAGIGDLSLTPSVNLSTEQPVLMRLDSGDFRRPSDFKKNLGPFDPAESVDLQLRVRDEFRNTVNAALPVAHAGANHTVECTSPDGAEVMLDGSQSTGDPNSSLSFQWTGPFGSLEGQSINPIVPIGNHNISLELENERGFTGTDEVTIEVTVGDACLVVCDPNTPGAIIGTNGSDRLIGTAGNDVIIGLGGNDRIIGLGGDDCIAGGAGNDFINGIGGNNQIDGGLGNDRIIGGTGANKIAGGAGNDRIVGGSGTDIITGGPGNDRINSASGDDEIDSGPGHDLIFGGSGTDECLNGERVSQCE